VPDAWKILRADKKVYEYVRVLSEGEYYLKKHLEIKPRED